MGINAWPAWLITPVLIGSDHSRFKALAAAAMVHVTNARRCFGRWTETQATCLIF